MRRRRPVRLKGCDEMVGAGFRLGRMAFLAAAMASALWAGAPAVAGTVPIAATDPVSKGAELIMVEQRGCWYCARWKAEVMPEYALTAEGRAAPLRMVQLDGPWPDGLALDSRPAITPTFILVEGGREVSRLEGYPGEDHFWPLLARMLAEAGLHQPQAEAGANGGG